MSVMGMFRQLSALHLSGLRVSKNNWCSLTSNVSHGARSFVTRNTHPGRGK
jgi:hypothetical protein